MAKFDHERRRLLLSTAAFIGGAAAFALIARIRPAWAWTTYEAPTNRGIGLAYAKRCGGANEHAAIMAQLKARLAEDPAAISETATCPLCGCAITVDR